MKTKNQKLKTQNCFPFPRFKGRILFDVPMKDYTSFRIGGPADVMVFPKGEDDLREILSFVQLKDFPVLFIGSGTNLLVRDGGIRGVVINLSDGFRDMQWKGEDEVTAGAGVKLSEIVNECRKRGLAGLEFAVQIPGTIGGAVVMNTGAYGKEIKDVVTGIDLMDMKGNKEFINKDGMRFLYRGCILPSNHIITSVHLKFKRDDTRDIERRIKEFKKKRGETQSVCYPSAGSIFKNPNHEGWNNGVSAGKLIDEAGLKGTRIGGAMVSDVHANYIVNLGSAKAADVITLLGIIRDKVLKEKGVMLEEEIKIVGED
ncbi:MAG: UDP-N-acetylenolpyruvoylglucosamine reductase [Deltaproteobacteria bacterium GWC2_42_11]|nr:MAG: UDP-N-acetylenolpyruvoylglucosamine reductase [Deltaproteobacteria bacterium GWC2_42_11]